MLTPEEKRLRLAARKALAKARENGSIVPQPCRVCGDPTTQAHHENYVNPLEVQWMCKKHHSEHHARERYQAKREQERIRIELGQRGRPERTGKTRELARRDMQAIHWGGPKSQEDKARSYQRWRAQIPFTNAQIATALREGGDPVSSQVADWLERTDRLTSKIYTSILPRLVKWCGICGKTALYRYGPEGRCRIHKYITTEAWRQRRDNFNIKNDALTADAKTWATPKKPMTHKKQGGTL